MKCTVIYIFGEKSGRESMDTEEQSHCEGHVLNTSTDELPFKLKKKVKIIQVACGYM